MRRTVKHSATAPLASKLLVALIVVVRLSVSLLHTHAQALDHCRENAPVVTLDAHCFACDLESTAAVESGPIVTLPSDICVVAPREFVSESPDTFVTRDSKSSRGPPAEIAKSI